MPARAVRKGVPMQYGLVLGLVLGRRGGRRGGRRSGWFVTLSAADRAPRDGGAVVDALAMDEPLLHVRRWRRWR